MSRGHNPLFWMMACTLPTAGHALGLGEIHVDSALNEPLAAEIDIVGATPDELVGLIATVANRETFAHFNAERPSFLNTTTFKVTKDARGKPVLAIRSSESFTEPLIDFVVDLRWRNGQLIRQYSLLLDPAGYPAATQFASALPVPPTQSALPAPVVTTAAASTAVNTGAAPVPTTRLGPHKSHTGVVAASESSDAAEPSAADNGRTMTQIKVGPRATLRGIAWRIGARSDADLNQMMIAVFRANPSAFDGNINRLHLGAVLKIPSAEQVAAISHAEANRETHAQMQAWRDGAKHPVRLAAAPVGTATAPASAAPAITAPSSTSPAETTAAHAVAATAAAAPSAPAAPATPAAAPTSVDAGADKAALTSKIVSLEGSLQEIQAQLEAQHNKLLTMQAQVRYAEQHPKVMVQPAANDPVNNGLLKAALAGMAVLGGLCVALLLRLRRRAKTSALPSIEKVPVVAPVEAVAFAPAAPAAKVKPAPVVVRAPEPPPIEVHEEPAEPRVETRIGMAEMRPDEQHEPSESALELSAADTSGINATKLREELAAAWALPAAETYKREDINHESTLAQDIAKSLEDTMNLEPVQARSDDDTIEDSFAETIANPETDTIVGEAGETGYFTSTEVLPESTMKMSPGDFPGKIDPEQVDYDLNALGDDAEEEVHDTVNMKGDAAQHDENAATDKIKITGELKQAMGEYKLGADDPKLALHDELASWAKKSA